RRRFEAFETATAGRLRVGVHIRCGDFAPRTTTVAIPAGERNVRLPLSWYITLCREIRAVADVQFVLQSDGTPDELRDFLDEFQPHHTLGEPYQDMLGALILSACDLALCSNSTYARLAMYMNDKPYIWSAETLYPDQSGRFGYLWREKDRPLPTADRSDPHATRRCYAVSIERPRLPEGARRYLHAGAALPTEIADDLLLRQPVHLFV
ncbi:MAG TPA: hypothetical protein PLD47_18390, partial [Aggregatilineales bacterium]|nr:hypothetical protein [Aggregatilineales bacterium]